MRLSPCLEWVFADEAADFADRIGLAQAAGFDAVEFWLWSNKDLDAVEAALRRHGVGLTSFVAEPMIALTDPANRAAFVAGLARRGAWARPA